MAITFPMPTSAKALGKLMPLTPSSFHWWPQDSEEQGKQAVSGYHCNANVSLQIQSNKQLF